ncbi:MAG: hypothetical protein EOM87_06925 [Clostridia bacterium]|nr:hypothetical protein [Clostridia bacterium]
MTRYETIDITKLVISGNYVEILDKKMLDDFLNSIYSFHDWIITSINYLPGCKKVKMRNGETVLNVLDDKRQLIVRFESYDDYVIELLFEDTIKMELLPIDPIYTTIIFEANIKLNDGKFVFYKNADECENNDLNTCKDTYIIAKRLKYRII